MPIVAEQYDFVVGVDTHARTHTFAIINAATGEEIGNETFPVTVPGGQRVLAWIRRRSGVEKDDVLISMEGTGSYGAKLRHQAVEAGFRVVEAPSPERKVGRYRGKSDAIDAARAARTTLGLRLDKLNDPRNGEYQTALRVLTISRESLARERTAAINSLTALVRTIDLGLDARSSLTISQISTVASWREREEGLGVQVSRREATRLAKQIKALDSLLAANHAELKSLVEATYPALLGVFGVGPVIAARILMVWSHPGRIKSEAAFAALAGTCPVPASSGSTNRFRLNRGGDRQLNKAFYTIALIRMNYDPRTKEYVQRRIAEGRNKKEIIRSLKRYITRQIYRTLEGSTSLT